MQTTDPDIFDLEVRSLVENAEAEVPEGVWTAVNASLGKAVRPFHLWRYVAVTAAAAAIVAGVFFGLRTPSVPMDSPAPALVAAAVPETEETVAEAPVEVRLMETVPEEEAPLLAKAEPVKRPAHIAARNSAAREEAPSEAAPEKEVTDTFEAPSETPAREHEAPSHISSDAPSAEAFEVLPELAVERNCLHFKRASSISIDFSSNSSFGGKPGPFIPPRRAPGMPSSTTIREAAGDSDYSLPLTAGLGIRFSFGPSKRFGIGTGIEYTRLSHKFHGQYFEYKDGVSTRILDGEITNTQQYIGVPLNLYMDIFRGNRLSTYVFAGATAEKCVDNSFRIPDGKDYTYWRPKVDGFQFSTGAGLGVQYRLFPSASKPEWMLFAQPDIRYFFDCDQPKSIRTQQPLQLSLTLGIRLGF